MNLTQAREAIEIAFEEDLPIFVWGDPGGGKSATIQSIVKDAGVELRDIRLSQIESIDLRGLPSINGDKTVWHVPSFMPSDMESTGVIFLDEANDGDPSTQAACYQLVLERRIGDYVLPPGWRIVAAGNPHTNPITEALANRFTHITVEPTITDWAVWAAANKVHDDIIAFLMFKPDYLQAMPTDQDEYAFPSPRTWVYASAYHTRHTTSSVHRSLIEGTVGMGATAEFYSFINLIAKLPTIDDLVADPTGYDFNDSPSKTAALALMVAHHITRANLAPLMQFIGTIQSDFQVLAVAIINKTKNHLMVTDTMTQWTLKNHNVL